MVQDFYIKNMVCDRCIKVLQDELKEKNFELLEIELGRIKLNILAAEDKEILVSILEKNGFSLIDSPEKQLVELVKIELIKLLKRLPLDIKEKLSAYLERKLNREYSKTSKLFSVTEGITIEKYFIKLKIEKVKELIENQEHNFTEIGQLLNYSNINHLSRQFKNETGINLTDYKSEQKNNRTPLDRII
ncbi:helix-turn-helix domain-containing protein [Bizionia myxarmorum]|uniref:Helix-turn-helix transcriptional regulator n=1 Tax=Bizionia myxarmorum TaxID=291186 RepID=A0A5D0RDJ7_9FLAO|nr:AraC family transcriptional regulator [Bizionia myxarmorum]TYB79760.1 helix-turn-helix transcriptional regulator [Bizionia myxarmorum]